MDPGIVDNGDGEDGAAVAQRLREEMEWDRARADASKTRKAADRFRQAVVEVDEEGTVAAAATGLMIVATSSRWCLQELVFDRPFAFIIRHDATQLPAFVGIVNDPRSSS